MDGGTVADRVPGLRFREPVSYPIGAKSDATEPAHSAARLDPLRHNTRT